MSDLNKQQNILRAIDRIVDADEPADPAVMGTEDDLLGLARELKGSAPVPSADFARRLDERMSIIQKKGSMAAEEVPRGSFRRWLPGWMTFPRLAAGMAVLITALGIAGLAGALIREYLPDGITDPDVSSMRSRNIPGAGSDALDMLSSRGSADESLGTSGAFNEASPSAGTAPQDSSPAALPTLPAMPQHVIQTADYDIEVERGRFQENFDRISALAEKYGGYVVTASASQSEEDAPLSGHLTIRVAATGDNFTRAQSELDGLGATISKNVSGQDVTEEYVDLESRLRNAQAQEGQLLALMQRAQTISEILAVQSRLDATQAQIEQIRGRIQFLDSRTNFATLDVDLFEEGKVRVPDDRWGFLDAIGYAGWLGVQTVNFVIISLGIIIPAGFILVIVAALAYRLKNRLRN